MTFLSFLPLVQLLLNATLMGLGQAGTIPAGSVNLAADIEAAFGPLIAALANHSGPASDVMASYSAVIGVLTLLKQTGKLDAATVAKIDQYITSAQDGTAMYLTAGKGYDPSNYPVQPAPGQ